MGEGAALSSERGRERVRERQCTSEIFLDVRSEAISRCDERIEAEPQNVFCIGNQANRVSIVV
jgi:hypothetical protein